MNNAPIAIFAFNRSDTLSMALENLSRCENLSAGGRRKCYAFIDGPRSPNDELKIRNVLNVLERFKESFFPSMTIIARDRNLGNPVNMPSGISQVLNAHGRAIIVEDDILVSRTFLLYMDAALEKYANEKRVWCINAWRSRYLSVPSQYRGDVYLNVRNMCWGWGTWEDRWDSVDMSMSDWAEFKCSLDNLEKVKRGGVELPTLLDSQAEGRLKAWDVQCSYHMAKNELYAIEPVYALTKNIGFGTVCDHCSGGNAAISNAKYYNFNPKLVDFDNLAAQRMIMESRFRYAYTDPRICGRIIRKLKRICWGLGPRFNDPMDI